MIEVCGDADKMVVILKVSKFQNEFMNSSFLPKYEPSISGTTWQKSLQFLGGMMTS